MKLHNAMLERFIDLEGRATTEIRRILDDLGLEVKGIEGEAQGSQQTIYTIETLANRGDHLSALGVARELSARLLTSIKMPTLAQNLSDRKVSLPVAVRTDLCLRYAMLELSLPSSFGGVLPEVEQYLKRQNATGKHTVVDTLNYVQSELGQPMHAFDRERVQGEIAVTVLEKEEEVVALDNKTYRVPAGSIVIRDKVQIIAVAGVIGCANSMVTESTKKVLIESATFDPVAVRKAARAMGLSTEASYAFERGADPENVTIGLRRALYLLSSGSSGEGAQCLGFTALEPKQVERRKVVLTLERLRSEMGLPRLTDGEVVARLKNLGFTIEVVAPTTPKDKKIQLSCVVPSWRLFDLRNEDDLVEEFVRVKGLDEVKRILPPLDPEIPELNAIEHVLSDGEQVLHGGGFVEVITRSLYSAKEVAEIERCSTPRKEAHVGIKNALESSYSHLRITNMLNLAKLGEANLRRGVTSFKVYEVCRLFSLKHKQGGRYAYERDVLTLGVMGRWNPTEWRKPEERDVVVMKAKGVFEAYLRALHIPFTIEEGDDGLFHPGIQCVYKQGRTVLGRLGVMHPELQAAYDCRLPLVYGELELEALSKLRGERSFPTQSDLPAIKRDITLKLPQALYASSVESLIASCEIAILTQVQIVDTFTKEGEEIKRVTFRVTFQSAERTLEHAEVDGHMQMILSKLKEKLSVEQG
jgi:phenylalanyl-tRNA synthetase beta chain